VTAVASEAERPTMVLCSKSTWSPAIRREHALALMASARGHRVMFVEQPADIRHAAGPDRRAWLRGLAGRAETEHPAPGLEVVPRSTLLPGHLGFGARAVDSVLLARSVKRAGFDSGATVIATTPWQWSAVSSLPCARRVFDCADDWTSLLPRQRKAIARLYRRIGAEADALIVNAEPLARLFAPHTPVVVRNGTSPQLLASPITPAPEARRLVYAGTLSERLDVTLIAAVLERLQDWRLDLYGECRYAGHRDEPAPELRRLLRAFPNRLKWHGPVTRDLLSARLDAARVLILPHRRQGAITGDAMKLYDYAARGRPIVSTSWSDRLVLDGPPHLRLADTADRFADAVLEAQTEPFQLAQARRVWAEEERWESRWESWTAAVFAR
jgi:glycosyltransferase involved in cell wall biosynthesis